MSETINVSAGFMELLNENTSDNGHGTDTVTDGTL